MSRKYSFISLALFLLSTFAVLLGGSAFAEEVYRFVDGDGQVHYSTTPPALNAKPAALPEIAKENIDRRIIGLQAATPASCEEHGGVDCSRGADLDGSVVCFDGFKDAALLFNSHCVESKLEANLFLTFGEEEEMLPHSKRLGKKLGDKKVEGIQLSIRNLSQAEAKQMYVAFQVPDNSPHPRYRAVEAAGPQKIDGFGLADYTLRFDDRALSTRQLELIRFTARCLNCRPVVGSMRR